MHVVELRRRSRARNPADVLGALAATGAKDGAPGGRRSLGDLASPTVEQPWCLAGAPPKAARGDQRRHRLHEVGRHVGNPSALLRAAGGEADVDGDDLGRARIRELGPDRMAFWIQGSSHVNQRAGNSSTTREHSSRRRSRGSSAPIPGLVRWNREPSFVVRADERSAPRASAIVSGGGSGHEPLHTGFVGRGMLDAAVPGGIFASPSMIQVRAATDAVDRTMGAACCTL